MFSIQKPSCPHFGHVIMKWSLQTIHRCLVHCGFSLRSLSQKRHAEPPVEPTPLSAPFCLRVSFMAWLTLDVSQGRVYRNADARIPSAAKVSTGFLPVALVADEAQSCFQPVYVVGCFSCGAIYAAAVIPEPLFEFV